MAATRKTKLAHEIATDQPPAASEELTLGLALAKDGENRTPELLSPPPTRVDGPNKMDRAIKKMEEMWDEPQVGKVKRKDFFERFIDEAGLTKARASTYYGNIKKKLPKTL